MFKRRRALRLPSFSSVVIARTVKFGFCPIHLPVRFVKLLFYTAIDAPPGHADGNADPVLFHVFFRCRDRVPERLFVQFRIDDRELIAAYAVAFPRKHADDVVCRAADEAVSGAVAHAVIDRFQPVQVNGRHAQPGKRLLFQLLHIEVEFVPVEQICQRVLKAQFFQKFRLFLDLSFVLINAFLKVFVCVLPHLCGKAHISCVISE